MSARPLGFTPRVVGSLALACFAVAAVMHVAGFGWRSLVLLVLGVVLLSMWIAWGDE